MKETTTDTELATHLYQLCYRTGEFKLRSGKTSHEYFDKYQFEARPKTLRRIAKALGSMIPGSIDYLAALELGGIPIATALALETGFEMVFVRKKPKDYGTCRFAEGPEIRGKRLLLIEDVITTGGQVVMSANDLRSEGAVVEHVLAVLDRSGGDHSKLIGAGLTLNALFTMDDLKAAQANSAT